MTDEVKGNGFLTGAQHARLAQAETMINDPIYADATRAAWDNLQTLMHLRSLQAGWWHDPDSGKALAEVLPPSLFPYVVATKLMLSVSEIAEGMEGARCGKMDDKLPHRSMLEVELADLVIRAMDLAGMLRLDIVGAIIEKSRFNTTRPDHDIKRRLLPGGKKF